LEVRKIFSITLVLILSLASLWGCSSTSTAGEDDRNESSSSESAKETTFERAKREGMVTVGFANEKPYAYRDANGELTGEAVEIARVILKRLGINEMKGELTEFSALIPGLQAKRFDMITAGMYITPNRCQQVAFANPEYRIGEALAVKKGNQKNLHSYEDIANQPDVKVAVMSGAAEKGYLEKVGVKPNQIVIVNDQPSAVAALQAGRVDAITMTGPSLNAVLESAGDKNIERVTDFKQPIIDGKSVLGYGATAFRKEDKDFLEAFNRELQKMKDSGELLEILQQFGFTESELPGDMTAENLCKK
jgi:polar amino acid transport system substrate-binding protein